jgi:hypothetical protein
MRDPGIEIQSSLVGVAMKKSACWHSADAMQRTLSWFEKYLK